MDMQNKSTQSLALLAPVTRSLQRVMALPKRTRTALIAVGCASAAKPLPSGKPDLAALRLLGRDHAS